MPPRCVVAALVAWLSCYAPSLSCAQAVQDTGLPVQKDRVPDKNKPSPTDGQEGSGVLVLPVEFQSAPESGRHARALLGSSLLPLGGSIHGQGYYYATLHLGTPPRPFQVIIDTGSTMTYVPCSTCSHCGKHADPYFDLSSSSSSQTVSCSDHDRCYTKLCTGTSCSYTRHYAEDSISSGTIVSDLLSLPGPSVQSHPGDTSRNDSLASDLSQYRVAFGCEAKETGDIYTQNADGIMGIGRGAISIPAQLAAQGAMADVFALCYGDFDGGGSLVLGDVVPPDTIQYTPLKKQPLHPAYYQVEVLSASIGGSIVSVPARAYAVGYGAVFDSGTTFSYFPTIVFNALKHAIMEKVELDTVPGPDPRYHDLCYGDAGDESSLSSHFPNIVLEFAPMPGSASAKLTLSPMNYLFTHSRPGAYCLGIFDNGNAGTLLGGIIFRNKLVIYDRERERIGFADESCSTFVPRTVPVTSGTHRQGTAVEERSAMAVNEGKVPEGAHGKGSEGINYDAHTVDHEFGESSALSWSFAISGSIELAVMFSLGIIVGGGTSMMIFLSVRRLAAWQASTDAVP